MPPLHSIFHCKICGVPIPFRAVRIRRIASSHLRAVLWLFSVRLTFLVANLTLPHRWHGRIVPQDGCWGWISGSGDAGEYPFVFTTRKSTPTSQLSRPLVAPSTLPLPSPFPWLLVAVAAAVANLLANAAS